SGRPTTGQAIRREGFPNYQVKPAGDRETYSAIIYLEPFTNRNLRAFGYDMLSESVRRAALERARDQNTAALTGKVILVQETGQEVQAGTLMYLPVYRHGLPIETLEQRRAALQGWVYSPYRMTDLMRGTLGGWDVKEKHRQLRLQIYDGEVLSKGHLTGYPAHPAGFRRAPLDVALYSVQRIDLGGRIRPGLARFIQRDHHQPALVRAHALLAQHARYRAADGGAVYK
ncbi:MAG: CHASE domain-containing protein, partial [Verrucomicrobia bacterium]|nr:CHASE domain-containing protein [Verrucomicrobiota bacterium]